jgi:hypothetical protein
VFLFAFHSIHFVTGFLLHEVHGWSVLECRTVRDGASHGRSVIEGAVPVVRECFSEGPPLLERCVVAKWMVRPEVVDSPPGVSQCC